MGKERVPEADPPPRRAVLKEMGGGGGVWDPKDQIFPTGPGSGALGPSPRKCSAGPKRLPNPIVGQTEGPGACSGPRGIDSAGARTEHEGEGGILCGS